MARSSLRERRESRVPTRRLGMLNCEPEEKKINERIAEKVIIIIIVIY